MKSRIINLAEYYLIRIYVILICLFILAPIILVVLSSFQEGRYIAYPVEHFSLKWYTAAINKPEWRGAIWTSIKLAVTTAILATVVGILAGMAIHYHNFPGKNLVSIFFLSPLLMPQLITGLALLYFFANANLSGKYITLLLGHVLISFPYVVRLTLAALPSVKRSLEEASMTLGADEFTTFVRITLPIIGPAIRGGALFAFIASYNNVLISVFLSTPRVVTMPVKVFEYLQWVADPTIAAISTLFLIVTFIVIWVLEKTVKIEIIPGLVV